MTSPICRRIKTNGKPCESPALRGSAFCYYHRTLHRSHRRLLSSPAPRLEPNPSFDSSSEPCLQPAAALPDPLATQLELPPLEDADSIQLALSLVVSAVARNRIDSRRAAAILYGLQIASRNVRSTTPEPFPPTLVRAITHTRSGLDLAPSVPE